LNQDIISEIKNQDYFSITETIEKFLVDQIEKNHAKGVILGLSGGIDSAVLAYLCKRKLKKNTLAIIMPDTTITPKIETELIDIKPIINEYSMYLEPNDKSKGNLRARVRTNILYYYANVKNYLVLGSSDKSENLIGYFTKFGDGASDITPIISLYKLQVRELAKHLKVPDNVISKKSSPHLWEDHEAEKELGLPYEEIDSILYCLFDKKLSVKETQEKTQIEKSVIENSEHKRLTAQKPVIE